MSDGEHDDDAMEATPAPNPTEVAEAKKAAGNAAYSAGDYAKAVELYSEAVDLVPSNGVYYNNRAAAYIGQKNYKKALSDCTAALELDANNAKALGRAGKCCLCMGDFSDAQRYYGKALVLEPSNAAVLKDVESIQAIENHTGYARQSLASKDYSRALYNIEQALQFAPQSSALNVLKGEILIGQQKYGEALVLAQQLLTRDMSNPNAWYLRGMAQYQNGDNDKAKAALQEALKMEPDHSISRVLLKRVRDLERKKVEGNDAFKAGDFAKACEIYGEALQVDPTNANVNSKLYSNRAMAKSKLGETKEALEDYSKAIELDPQYTKAYQRRAELNLKAEKYQEAVHDYSKAKELEPESREIRDQLRKAELELKKSQRKDLYKILGVGKDADEGEIKKAYKKMALLHHPDKCQSTDQDERDKAEAKFKDINEAYSTLTDPQKKARYDSGADLDESGGHGHGGMDMNDIFSMFGGGFPGGAGGFPGGGFPGGGGGFPGGGGFSFGGFDEEDGGFGGGVPFGGGMPGGSARRSQGSRRGRRH